MDIEKTFSSKNESKKRYTFLLDNTKDIFLNRFVPYITIFIIVYGFIYIYATSLIDIPEDRLPIIQSITEFIKTIMIMAASFWVGSSVGSKLKDTSFEQDNDMIEYSYKTDNIDDLSYNTDNEIETKEYAEYSNYDKSLMETILTKYKTDSFLVRFVPYLSILIMLLGFTYLIIVSVMTFNNIYSITSSIEFIKSLLTMVISFWVGSSVGSKLKYKGVNNDK